MLPFVCRALTSPFSVRAAHGVILARARCNCKVVPQPGPSWFTGPGEWATTRRAAEDTLASIARNFRVSWPTVSAVVERVGRTRVAAVEALSSDASDELVPVDRRSALRPVTACDSGRQPTRRLPTWCCQLLTVVYNFGARPRPS